MYFYLISAVAALGGLLFGYDTGVISGALLFIRQVMSLSPTLQGIVVAIALAGAAIGAAMAGYLSDRIGRRRVILTAGLLFIAGAIVSAIAQEVTILLIGRFLVGLAIGVASMLTPLYLAEISPASDRGAIVSLNQLCITAGILVSYLVGFALAGVSDGWRWMVALGAVPGIILSLGMLVLPESPRWLAGHNRTRDAESVLRRLRGTADISDELSALRTDIAREGRRHRKRVGAALPAPPPPSDHWHRPCDVPTDHRHQHGHLFRAHDFPIRGPVLRGDLHPGHRRGRRGQRDHDDRIYPPDRSARPAATAVLEPRRHGRDTARAVRRLLCRHVGPARLDRGPVGCRICWLLRDRTRPGVLVADRGNLPTRSPRQGNEPSHGCQLELQPDRLRHLPQSGRRGR